MPVAKRRATGRKVFTMTPSFGQSKWDWLLGMTDFCGNGKECLFILLVGRVGLVKLRAM
jgi:hypothetical protein